LPKQYQLAREIRMKLAADHFERRGPIGNADADLGQPNLHRCVGNNFPIAAHRKHESTGDRVIIDRADHRERTAVGRRCHPIDRVEQSA
jgi:hypothetical protein